MESVCVSLRSSPACSEWATLLHHCHTHNGQHPGNTGRLSPTWSLSFLPSETTQAHSGAVISNSARGDRSINSTMNSHVEAEVTGCDIVWFTHGVWHIPTANRDEQQQNAARVNAPLTCFTTSGGSSLRHCFSCREANECSAYEMVPYSIHRDRLEPSISRALLKQFSTACECFHMGTSLFSSLELSFSWIRLARARAIPAQESNLRKHTVHLLS